MLIYRPDSASTTLALSLTCHAASDGPWMVDSRVAVQLLGRSWISSASWAFGPTTSNGGIIPRMKVGEKCPSSKVVHGRIRRQTGD